MSQDIRVVLASIAVLAGAVTAVTAACGGADVVDRVDPTRSEVLVFADGGGRVVGPLGSYILVPSGALTADTRIGITLAADGTYVEVPDAAAPRGAVFAFTPHGLAFAVPAEIGIPTSVTEGDEAIVIRAGDPTATWARGPVATFSDAGFAVFNTSQLSLYTVVAAGDGGLDAIFPLQGCSPDVRDARWAAMLASAIGLPGRVGTLDLAGAGKTGISRAEVEAALCAGTSRGKANGDDTETVAWGGGGDLAIVFDDATKKARYAIATGAYQGALDTGAVPVATPGGDAGAGDAGDAGTAGDGGAGAGGFHVQLGQPLTKGGAPVTIPWTDAAALGALMDDLERAMLATFKPGDPLPVAPCTAAPARCERGALGTQGYLYFRSLGLAIWVGDTTNAAKASTPSRLDVYAVPTP
jgi:hypothetical protein